MSANASPCSGQPGPARSFLRHGLSCVLLLGLHFPGPSQAQVYRCTDPTGATSYQSVPCQQHGQPLELDTRQPSDAERRLNEERSRQDNARLRRIEAEREASAELAREQHGQRRKNEQLAAERCRNYLAEAEQLERSGNRRSGSLRGEKDRDKARKLRDRHFSECFAR
ncbi:DUF4124 domain-containing protein [Azoarcus indigens]|uniref:Uncharacterized protein DUF4124 n=1 Tax=Azoarcus indigens TaxID=29545 RepID=A0A4V3BP73_9RHOO|nr:DUF4124 domain-containing protein [Azoarcus indigens]NMG63589.1 DUF4124 domain-containing protein [Azoarcus indigens]TDN57141.1 uncharacterized protein DUF4124 [Azoarcus indigens]